MKLNISILLALLIIVGCKNKKPTPIPLLESKLDIVWEKKYSDNANSSIIPVLFDNSVIFSKEKEGHTELTSYNKMDGITNWNKLYINIGDANNTQSTAQINNALGLTSGGRLISVNLENGDEQWHFNTDNQYSCYRVSAIGEDFYYTRDKGLETARLSKTNSNILDWETVFSLNFENNYRPSVELPVQYIAANMDTIIIFQNRTHNSITLKERVDLYAYNTTTNNIEWRLDSITPTGGSSVHLPLVVGDRVYLEGGAAIICVDIPTGEILWKHTDDSNALLFCNLVFAEGKIIVNPYTGSLFAIDANTGELNWKIEDNAGLTSLNMVYYNGHVFYGSADGKLFAVKVSNGEIKWAEYPPGQTSAFLTQNAFQDGVTIDQESGLLYTNDGFNVMCIKIPDNL